MPLKNIMDQHTHTDNSFDGHHNTMFLCENAVQKGLRSIAFTDHIEMDRYRSDNFDRTAVQSYFESAKARSAFTGRLLVQCGVELGQPVYDKDSSEGLINSMSYDIVIGSVHNLRNKPDFCDLDYNGDIELCYALLDEYFDEELLLAQWGRFDTLAHLTYPLRYMVGEQKLPIDISRYSKIIDDILSAVIENGKALEINTSGFRQPLGMTMPGRNIISRFRQLGGKYVTVGSDAHYAEHLGAGIEDGMLLARECGFSEITLFIDRYPTAIPIE